VLKHSNEISHEEQKVNKKMVLELLEMHYANEQ
jgi:hypothetical protein